MVIVKKMCQHILLSFPDTVEKSCPFPNYPFLFSPWGEHSGCLAPKVSNRFATRGTGWTSGPLPLPPRQCSSQPTDWSHSPRAAGLYRCPAALSPIFHGPEGMKRNCLPFPITKKKPGKNSRFAYSSRHLLLIKGSG